MQHSRNSPRGHELTKRDYEVLAQFRYLLRKFAGFSQTAARRAGLTAQQHQALLAIQGFPGSERITMGKLAERLSARHHSTVGLVDRLVARTLVHRRRDPRDGRCVLIEITPRGRKVLAGLSLSHHDELRELAPLLKRLLEQVSRGSSV